MSAEKGPLKMLVCSDGGEQAERAVRFAALIGAAEDVDVSLLGIAENTGDQKPLMDKLRREQEILRRTDAPTEIVTRSGDVVREIARRTEAEEYDVVVIGAEHRGTHGPFWRSAKAYRIIKAIQAPVLVVVGKPEKLDRILLCSGGRGYIDSALGLIARLAGALPAQVTLVHVLPEPPVMYADMIRDVEDADRLLASESHLGRHLRRERDQLVKAGVVTEVRVVHGLVGAEILRELRRGKYDLAVCGKSVSRSPVETYIMGDITREIVNRAPCPVLVVNSQPGFASSLGKVWSAVRGIFRRSRSAKGSPSKGPPAPAPPKTSEPG